MRAESADETSRPGCHIPFSPATGQQPRIIPVSRAANPRSEASRSSTRSSAMQNEAGGAGGAGAWPQRQPEQAHKAVLESDAKISLHIPSYTVTGISRDIPFQDTYTGISQYKFCRLCYPWISRDNSHVGLSRDNQG